MDLPSGTQQIRAIVEEACKKETNIFGYGIWTHHIVYVVQYGKLLAERLEADAETVELAALLHDYASIKDESLYGNHHLYGPLEAERILRELDYPEEKIHAVKQCIASHRASIDVERVTPEAVCLASADAMAHIDQVPSLLYLAFVRFGMSIDEGTTWVREKLARSWQKLCPEAQAMMKDKYEAALVLLNKAFILAGENRFP
jgi:HD domain